MEGDVLKEKIVKTWDAPMIMFLFADTDELTDNLVCLNG